MEKCIRCGKEFKDYDQLRRHTSRTHKVESLTFYVERNLNGEWPTCKCGCGEKMKWDAENKKFRDYAHGHCARIKNNWGHNPKVIEKSVETRRKLFASGELTTWNSGLTRETDDRIEKNIENLMTTVRSDSHRKMKSDEMRRNRLNGIVPTLFGPDSSRWKGGVSTLNQLARADRRLYSDWKYPILERDGFKCTKCGNSHNLHVHHNDETFSEVTMQVITKDDILLIEDNDKKRELVSRITDYHVKTPVSGITFCHDCHAELHPSLNFKK